MPLVFSVTYVFEPKQVFVTADRFVITEDGAVDFYVKRRKTGHFTSGCWNRVYVDATQPLAPKLMVAK